MNYKDFKKVSSDDKCTVLKHKDGHELKIAHKVLSPKIKSELDKLPAVKKMAQGGQLGGGEVDNPEPDWIKQGSKPGYQQLQEAANDNTPELSLDRTKQAMSNPEDPYARDYPSKLQDAAKFYGLSGNDAPAVQEPVADSQPDQLGQAPQAQPTEPERAPAAEPQQADGPVAQQAPQAVAPEQPDDEYKKSYNDYNQEHQQKFAQEDAAFAHDLSNGHVTPETFGSLFAKKDTLGKIGTIFGLMLSGFGSGLSGQPNALLSQMNQEIGNDLDAQKTDKTNAQNFIKLNQNRIMNEANAKSLNQQTMINADAFSRMQMNRSALAHMVSKVQAMSPSDPQYAAAQRTLAMMSQGVDAQNYNIGQAAAAKSAFFDMINPQSNGQGNEQQFQNKDSFLRMSGNEKLAEDNESKHFPGIQGKASVPLSGEDRTMINSGIDFNQKLNRFIDFTKKHSGDLSPSDRNSGMAMAAELQGAYRQATHGGVYKEGEQNFISKLIDSEPTKFFNNIRVLPQLNAIASENKARVNQLVKSKGFDGYNPQGEKPSSSGDSSATMSKSGKPMVQKNGKWYYQ